MSYDKTRLFEPAEVFNVSFTDNNIWQLRTTMPEAFEHCGCCAKEFRMNEKKMLCTIHRQAYCWDCDTGKITTGRYEKWKVECAFSKKKGQHQHFNISQIEEIKKHIKGE